MTLGQHKWMPNSLLGASVLVNDVDMSDINVDFDLGLLLGDLGFSEGIGHFDSGMEEESSLPNPSPDILPSAPLTPAKSHTSHFTHNLGKTQASAYTSKTVATAKSTKTLDTVHGIKRKLKRYLLFKLGEEEAEEDIVNGENPNKRFSLGTTLRRMASNRSLRPSLVPKAVPSTVSGDSHLPYWKYHVIRYGNDLYLTTNPDTKHLYCRHGKGYFVEVSYTDTLPTPNPSNGFNLVFRDSNNTGRRDTPLLVITKKPQSQGGYMTVLVGSGGSFSLGLLRNHGPFNGLVYPKTIPAQFMPNVDTTGVPVTNFEFKDVNNVRWNVGLVPRVKTLTMTMAKVKSRLWMAGLMGRLAEDAHLSAFFGRNNVYFHQNYIIDDNEDDDDEDAVPLLYKLKGPVGVDDGTNDFPPVLAVFRPHLPQRMHKKLAKQLKRNRRPGGIMPGLGTIRHDQLDEDFGVGLKVDSYYTGGDGLYYVENPLDDCPDDDKLGWITVYEDDRVFSNKVMFDMVIGLSLAAGLAANT